MKFRKRGYRVRPIRLSTFPAEGPHPDRRRRRCLYRVSRRSSQKFPPDAISLSLPLPLSGPHRSEQELSTYRIRVAVTERKVDRAVLEVTGSKYREFL